MAEKRDVDTPPGAENQVLVAVAALSEKCVDGVYMALLELENPDPAIQPSLKHRCGQLASKYEIFALPIKDCGRYRLVISIDSDDLLEGQVFYHGVAPNGKYACETGKNLATSQFKLVNPVWEPDNSGDS